MKKGCRSMVRRDFDPGEKHGGREDMPRFSSSERYNTKNMTITRPKIKDKGVNVLPETPKEQQFHYIFIMLGLQEKTQKTRYKETKRPSYGIFDLSVFVLDIYTCTLWISSYPIGSESRIKPSRKEK